jgi:hypothetical protein
MIASASLAEAICTRAPKVPEARRIPAAATRTVRGAAGSPAPNKPTVTIRRKMGPSWEKMMRQLAVIQSETSCF